MRGIFPSLAAALPLELAGQVTRRFQRPRPARTRPPRADQLPPRGQVLPAARSAPRPSSRARTPRDPGEPPAPRQRPHLPLRPRLGRGRLSEPRALATSSERPRKSMHTAPAPSGPSGMAPGHGEDGGQDWGGGRAGL